MKFSEMKYVRPDMEALRQAAAQAVDAIANAADADEAAEAYLSWDKAGGSYATMNSLCYIRHTINTEDKFYDEENEFFDNAGPDFTELNQSVAKAVAESSFRRQMYFVASEHIARWGWLFKLVDFLVAPIMRYKGSVAASTAIEILKKIKAGHNVCVFAFKLFEKAEKMIEN